MKKLFICIIAVFVLFRGGFELCQAAPAPINYCAHPLFPLVAGNQWVYSGTAAAPDVPYTMSVLTVQPGQGVSTAVLTLSFEGSSQAYPLLVLSCDVNGIRLAEVYDFTVPLGKSVYLKLEMLSQEGYLLPSFDYIKTGATWSFEAVFKLEVSGQEQQRSFSTEVLLRVDSRLVGTTDVVVPAGAFPNSYEVEQVVQWSIKGGNQGLVDPGKMSISHTRLWYLAERVGQVQDFLRGTLSQLLSFVVR